MGVRQSGAPGSPSWRAEKWQERRQGTERDLPWFDRRSKTIETHIWRHGHQRMPQPSYCNSAFRWKVSALITKSIRCPCSRPCFIGEGSRARCTQFSHIGCRMTGGNAGLRLVLKDAWVRLIDAQFRVESHHQVQRNCRSCTTPAAQGTSPST